MLERLSPAERTAFVLHDVFQYPFDAIGDIVGRSPAACRQLASRARRTIADERGRSRFVVESSEQRRVVERFITACSVGDIKGLLEVLDPDVAGEGDLGGGRRRVSVGRDVIAPQIMVFLGPDSNASLVPLHTGADAHVVALRDGHVVSVVTLTVEDERVVHIHALADPVKLGPIADVLGVAGRCSPGPVARAGRADRAGRAGRRSPARVPAFRTAPGRIPAWAAGPEACVAPCDCPPTRCRSGWRRSCVARQSPRHEGVALSTRVAR